MKGKTTAVVLAVAGAVALYALEALVLKGDTLLEERFSVYDGETIPIEIRDVTREYTLDIYTRKETSLAWTLKAPDGAEVESETELATRQGHRLTRFRPLEPGTYSLEIGQRALAGRYRGTGSVEVLVDDRRIFTDLYSLLRFG